MQNYNLIISDVHSNVGKWNKNVSRKMTRKSKFEKISKLFQFFLLIFFEVYSKMVLKLQKLSLLA